MHAHYLQPLFDHLQLRPTQWLHHYTGVDTLLSMVKSDKPAFWLSAISYLNDSKELMHGHDLMLKRLNDYNFMATQNQAAIPFLKIFADILGLKRNTNSHMYVMSFSEAANSLSQWRSYTPHGKGISMSFDFTQGNDFLALCNLHLVQCLYDEHEQLSLIDALIEHTVHAFSSFFEDHEWPQSITDLPTEDDKFKNRYQHALSTGYKIFAIIKHPAFKDEKEWRLLAQNTNAVTEIDYRSGSNMLLPYLVAPVDLEGYLERITIGPTAHKELAEDAIAGLLRKHNLHISYAHSDIPYREW